MIPARVSDGIIRLEFRRRGQPRKIAVGKLECIAAGDHRVAVLELDEAAIHLAAHQDEAELAFAAMPIPVVDVVWLPKR